MLHFASMYKKTIITLFILFNTVFASCQVTTTVPLNTYDYPNGAYLKDLNNELPFWEGTWEGIANNKKYIFEFVIFRQHLITFPNNHYIDEIKGKLKVIDLNTSQELYNNLNITNYENFKIHGLSLRGSVFHFWFQDTINNCFNEASFSLVKDPATSNQIIYKNFELGEYIGNYLNCSYQNQSDIPMFLPRVNLVLTKQ